MASKNYSELISNKEKRQLTAKGNKFVWKCIDIIAANKNLHRYSPEFKGIKEKFYTIIYDLIVDKEMTIEQITNLIKSRNFIGNQQAIES